MLCFSEIASSFTLWGRAALPLPSGDADGAPPPRTPRTWTENLWALTGLRWGSICYRSFLGST